MKDIGTAAGAASRTGVVDKRGLLHGDAGVKLDLGCGARKHGPDYIGVDMLDSPGVDVVGDVFDVLESLAAGSVSRVYCSHMLEHVDDQKRLLELLGAVIAPGGELELIVPHFSNPYFYSDPTHVAAFGLYTLGYYVRATPFRRGVPTYGRDLPFRFAEVSLVFKSSPPFYGRHAFKRLAQIVVNRSRATQEFYEENLCYLIPCYEIRTLLVRQ